MILIWKYECLIVFGVVLSVCIYGILFFFVSLNMDFIVLEFLRIFKGFLNLK